MFWHGMGKRKKGKWQRKGSGGEKGRERKKREWNGRESHPQFLTQHIYDNQTA